MTDQYLPTNINAPRRTVTVAATTALNADASLVIVNTVGLGAAPTITLPDAREVDGAEIIIKAPVATVGSGGQNVIVSGLGGQTIDGAASVTLAVDQTALSVKSDNANWQIVCLTDANSGGEIIFGDLFLDAASPTLTIGNGTGSPALVLNKSDAGTAVFNMQVVGVTRWDWLFDASENLSLQRRDAAGVLQDAPITFDIAAGNVSIPNQILQGGAVSANGAAAATNIVVGNGTGSVGTTLFISAAGIGRYGVTDTSGGGAMRGGLQCGSGGDVLTHIAAGTAVTSITAAAVSPFATGARDLGTSALRWGRTFSNGIAFGVEPSAGSITVANNGIIEANASGGNVDVNLPAGVVGLYYEITISDATNNVDILPNGGNTVNGAASKTIAAGAEGRYIISCDSTGANWLLHGPLNIV